VSAKEDRGCMDRVISFSFSQTNLDRMEHVVVDRVQCIMKHPCHGGDLRTVMGKDAEPREPGQDGLGSSELMMPEGPGLGPHHPRSRSRRHWH
jgi:hypothetical protein